MLGSKELEDVLAAVGDLLQAEGERVGIVVVGGASLNLLGLIERTTSDVDVIARVHLSDDGPEQALVPPKPMPEPLVGAIETVARDFDLPADWMNAVIGAQWKLGLPPYLEEDLTWRTYGGLRVGLVGRPHAHRPETLRSCRPGAGERARSGPRVAAPHRGGTGRGRRLGALPGRLPCVCNHDP